MEIQALLILALQAGLLLAGFFSAVMGYVWLNARIGHRLINPKMKPSYPVEL